MRLFLLLAAALAPACAGPDQERNLAPLVSRHSIAGGDAEVEALGGMVLWQRDRWSAARKYWALRPFLSSRSEANGDRFAWFLPPLGFIDEDASDESTVAQFLPIARYAEDTLDSGFTEWSLLVLPSLYWAKKEDGSIQRAFIPFGGLVERFFSYDRVKFALFPLWLRTERHGRTTDHVLWPIFSFSRGAGGYAWRAWPLVGHNRWEGRYSRRFFLWPFLHLQHNGQALPESEQSHAFFFWPFFGRSRTGEATSLTLLWPLFGWTQDPSSVNDEERAEGHGGFWALDGLWPVIVFQGGDPERATRERVWPLYSRYEGDGLTQYWHPWPLINRRHEVYDDGEKRALGVFPFWRSYERTRLPGVDPKGAPEGVPTERWRKLWPLFRWRKAPEGGHFAFPDPNPFQELDFLDEHYAWLWELYSRTHTVDTLRTRSWLGLWRRERDRDEDRRSLSVLWSARDYTRAGREVRERSWLFGLLRYRTTEGEGFSLLAPAFPGPGWPMQRVPRSIVPAPGGDLR